MLTLYSVFISFCSDDGGLIQVARQKGLGDSVTLQLNRQVKTNGKIERFAINTDRQIQMEFSHILEGRDKLLDK